jgi:hypothetical protein
VVFTLTEVLGAKEFLGANDLRAILRGFLYTQQGFPQVLFGLGRAACLD